MKFSKHETFIENFHENLNKLYYYLWRARASPTLIMTRAPACGIMVSMSACITCLAFVAPWFLRSMYAQKCSVYSGILTCLCVIYNCTRSATCVCRENYQRRQVGECTDTWYKLQIHVHVSVFRQQFYYITASETT